MVVWWKVRDYLLLWLAFLFCVPVLLWGLYVTAGFFFGF
jgi:hypothetical protein